MCDALSLVRNTRDETSLIGALNSMADLYRGAGNAEAARPLYEEALALARKQENIVAVAHICDNLARLLISYGLAAAARDLVREVLVISNEARSRWIGLCVLDIASALAAVEDDWLFAARMRGAAEARVKSLRYRATAPTKRSSRLGRLEYARPCPISNIEKPSKSATRFPMMSQAPRRSRGWWLKTANAAKSKPDNGIRPLLAVQRCPRRSASLGHDRQ